MRGISISAEGITEVTADAIVNAANEQLQAGGGVCGAIFRAAGYDLLQHACDRIGHCDTGSAVITPGFKSKAEYIIHAVGPMWSGGRRGEARDLYSCYRKSLELARDHELHSICFPLISTGIYGYPAEEGWEIAIRACSDFLTENWQYGLHIIFAAPDQSKRERGLSTLRLRAPWWLIAVKSNWKTQELPAKREEFILEHSFSESEMIALGRGTIPEAMEDKWFCYMQGDTLCAHRSWTGYCVFTVRFDTSSGRHTVTVNRDAGQFESKGTDSDRDLVERLLVAWSRPKLYYHQ